VNKPPPAATPSASPAQIPQSFVLVVSLFIVGMFIGMTPPGQFGKNIPLTSIKHDA
jgi:hypothetical protein